MIGPNEEEHARLMAQFAREFLEDAADRVVYLTEIFEAARDGKQIDSLNLNTFRRELHTLKGQGGSYGFHSISLIAHRFEDFLLQFEADQTWYLPEVQEYLDALSRIIDNGKEPKADDVKALLHSLPGSTDKPTNDVTVVWICSARVIRHKIRRDLESFSFDVVSIHDPFDAMRYICKTRPDFVICSETLDGMLGSELIRILSTIEETKSIPAILVTSFDLKNKKIAELPTYVPILRLTPNIANDLAHALSSLEYKAVNPSFDVRK